MHDIETARPTVFLETLIHVLKGNLGAGLFAMGDAFKNSGFVLGIFGIICIGSICIYNNHLLVRLSRQVQHLKKLSKSPTFPETISYSFELGPRKFSRMQGLVMRLMKTCIILTQLGFCVIYITFVSRSLKTLIDFNLGFEINIRWYVLATFVPVLAISLIHNLKFLAPVSAISVIFIFYGFVVSLVLCAIGLPDISTREMVASPEQWPLFVGTVIFAFEGIALVIPLKNEMKEPEKFDSPLGALNIGMSICTNMFIGLGFLAYWKFGDEISGSVTFNLSASSKKMVDLNGSSDIPLSVAESARVLVALGILLTYPIQFYVPIKLFLRDIKQRWGPLDHPLYVEMGLRMGLVIVTYVFALIIPHVNLIVSLLGAVCSNALALLFPALADISVRCRPLTEEENQKKILKKPFTINDRLRFSLDGVSIVLSIFGAIFGSYIALRDIASEIRKDFIGPET